MGRPRTIPPAPAGTSTRRRFIGACAGIGLLSLAPSASAASSATFSLYRSVDDGRTWRKVGDGLPAGLRTDALGLSGRRRLAGTEKGIFVSDDDGSTWRKPARDLPEIKVFSFSAERGRIYAATKAGLWQSTDEGDTWDRDATFPADARVLSLATSGGLIFAGIDGQGVAIRREGKTDAAWESASAGLPANAQVFQFAEHDGQIFAALYSRGVYRYDRLGARWTAAGNERPLCLVAFRDRLFSGRNPGGVFTSQDQGKTWRESSRGLPPQAPTWVLATTPGTTLIGTAGPSGLMRWDGATESWLPSDTGLTRGGNAITFGIGEKSLLAVIYQP